MSKPKKVSWADIADEDDLELPTVISKHGIRVKKERPVPSVSDKPVKKSTRQNSKKDDM